MEIKSVKFNKTYNVSKAQLIGEGNFAQVYKIFDESLRKYIAIRRVVKADAEPEDLLKERQINEELQKVSNPNILEIFEIIETNDYVWYITEYCSGGSLWDALNDIKNHKFSEIDTLKCILQVARGVQQLHNHRITHRDLKPENILLTRKYKKGAPIPDIKVADFGLSTKSIIMQTVAGTKEYIAPEQAKFHTYTNSVDVWSIGIIFDELLHGQPYYTGENNKQVFNKILKEEYRVRDQKISDPIKALLINILKKKPYERPIIAVLKSRIQDILANMEEAADKKENGVATAVIEKSQKDMKVEKVFKEQKIEVKEAPQKPGPQIQKTLKEQRKNSVEQLLKPKIPKLLLGLVSEQILPVPVQTSVTPFNPIEQNSSQNMPVTNAEPQYQPPAHCQSSTTASVSSSFWDSKIPLFKNVKKLYNPFFKKNKKCDLVRSYIKFDELLKQATQARWELQDCRLRIQDFTFNPNCKIAPIDSLSNPFEKFTELKRDFEYLNEMQEGESYQIRILQTTGNLQKCQATLKKQISQSRAELRGAFFQQIDSYIEELVNKSIL